MSNLQPNCCLEFDFRKVDQHAGGKWLIHDTKRRKDESSFSPWNFHEGISTYNSTAVLFSEKVYTL